MAKIRKADKREMPAINTSSLPDIIFMLLFFFMTVTSMKEVTYKVNIKPPSATELRKIEKKSAVRYIYIGEPISHEFGSATRIQLDDAFAEVSQIQDYVVNENEAMSPEDRSQMVISIKADKDTRMGIISEVKQQLRQARALNINYAAVQEQK